MPSHNALFQNMSLCDSCSSDIGMTRLFVLSGLFQVSWMEESRMDIFIAICRFSEESPLDLLLHFGIKYFDTAE